MFLAKYIGHGLNKLLPTDACGSIFISSCSLNYIEVSLRIACEVLVVAHACLYIYIWSRRYHGRSDRNCLCGKSKFVLSTPHLKSRDQLYRIPHMHAKCVHTHFPQYGWQFSDRSLLDLGSAESYVPARCRGPALELIVFFFSFARFGSPSSRLGNRQDPNALVYGQKEAWLYTWAIWCRFPGRSLTKLLTARSLKNFPALNLYRSYISG